jgi:hypothetical protein
MGAPNRGGWDTRCFAPSHGAGGITVEGSRRGGLYVIAPLTRLFSKEYFIPSSVHDALENFADER